jgi:hypothetical protein
VVPERGERGLNQDDLYVDMTFAKVLDDKGLDATTEDFGAMFKEAKYALWHANLAAGGPSRGVPASWPAPRSTTPTPTTSTSRSRPTSSG